MKNTRTRNGFTLIEVLMASSVFTVVMLLVMGAYLHGLRLAKGVTSQLIFTGRGRTASQRIMRYVEEGKTLDVGPEGLSLDIMMPDLRTARIFYRDSDGDAATVGDNILLYVDDIGDPDAEETVICTHVSLLPEERLFHLVFSSPVTVAASFHIGDGFDPRDAGIGGTGRGYQGIEVRISATPRNLQRWYQ
jgi:prepilin-type N-terminal cleavage/methylation domain-containing protein